MRNFINKKAKNVKSDRYHRTSVIIENKVTVEEITPEVINPEIVVDLPLETEIEPLSDSIEVMGDVVEEQPKPKKKKNVKTENKETKIED
jgi:hypothetical protein